MKTTKDDEDAEAVSKVSNSSGSDKGKKEVSMETKSIETKPRRRTVPINSKVSRDQVPLLPDTLPRSDAPVIPVHPQRHFFKLSKSKDNIPKMASSSANVEDDTAPDKPTARTMVPINNVNNEECKNEEAAKDKLSSKGRTMVPIDKKTSDDERKKTLLEEETTNKVRLAPTILPPDATPLADEEEGGIPSEQAPPEQAPPEEAFSAYLAPDQEERRRRWLAQAIWATNVRAVPPRRRKRNKLMLTLVVVTIVIAAVVGISLGVTLSRRDGRADDPTTSASPTQAPTSARFGQVATLVESLVGTALDDPSSPQYQAAQWMAELDEMFEDLSTVYLDRFRQRYALSVFYFATGGPTSWIETFFFLKPDTHECEWRDTPLPETHSWSGFVGVVNCTLDQWVTEIEINQNNLTGSVPQELGSLSSFTRLTLFSNNIGGTLPPSLFHLPNINYINAWGNEITGPIPTEIGKATSLRFLVLQANALTGTIPSEIGNLSILYAVNLSDNFLTGSLPETLLQLSELYWLEVSENALTGRLPPSFSLSWPDLGWIGVFNNRLFGTIPNDLDSLPQLWGVNFGWNNFTGPFPSSIVASKNVKTFAVSRNALTGSLPNDWRNLSSTLERLFVHENLLTGTLPESLGNLSVLEYLEVNENEFSGTIPASLGNLGMLQTFFVRYNGFTGTVPKSFVGLTSLQIMSLHGNGFTGDISFLCNGTDKLLPSLHDFSADCLEEVVCPCCNICCARNGTCRYV